MSVVYFEGETNKRIADIQNYMDELDRKIGLCGTKFSIELIADFPLESTPSESFRAAVGMMLEDMDDEKFDTEPLPYHTRDKAAGFEFKITSRPCPGPLRQQFEKKLEYFKQWGSQGDTPVKSVKVWPEGKWNLVATYSRHPAVAESEQPFTMGLIWYGPESADKFDAATFDPTHTMWGTHS